MAESSDDDVEVLDLTMSVTKKPNANLSILGTSTSACSSPSYRPRSRAVGSKDTAATGAALESGGRSDDEFSLNQCRKLIQERPIHSSATSAIAAASGDAESRHAAAAAAAPVDLVRHDPSGNNDRATAVSRVQLPGKGKGRARDGRAGEFTRKREEIGGADDDGDGYEDDDDHDHDHYDADFLVLTQEVSKFEVAGTQKSEVVDLLSDSDEDEGEGRRQKYLCNTSSGRMHVRVFRMPYLSFSQLCTVVHCWQHGGRSLRA